MHDDAALAEIEKRALALAASRKYDLKVFCAYEGCEVMVKSRKHRAKAAGTHE